MHDEDDFVIPAEFRALIERVDKLEEVIALLSKLTQYIDRLVYLAENTKMPVSKEELDEVYDVIRRLNQFDKDKLVRYIRPIQNKPVEQVKTEEPQADKPKDEAKAEIKAEIKAAVPDKNTVPKKKGKSK